MNISFHFQILILYVAHRLNYFIGKEEEPSEFEFRRLFFFFCKFTIN